MRLPIAVSKFKPQEINSVFLNRIKVLDPTGHTIHWKKVSSRKFFSVSVPDDYRLDILAQNHNGVHAIHSSPSLPPVSQSTGICLPDRDAGSSSQSSPRSLIEMFKYIGDKLLCTEEALKTLNNEGLMPFQMTSSREIREALLPSDGPEVVNIPPEGVGIKVASRSRVALQSIDIKRLIALWSEFSM